MRYGGYPGADAVQSLLIALKKINLIKRWELDVSNVTGEIRFRVVVPRKYK